MRKLGRCLHEMSPRLLCWTIAQYLSFFIYSVFAFEDLSKLEMASTNYYNNGSYAILIFINYIFIYSILKTRSHALFSALCNSFELCICKYSINIQQNVKVRKARNEISKRSFFFFKFVCTKQHSSTISTIFKKTNTLPL